MVRTLPWILVGLTNEFLAQKAPADRGWLVVSRTRTIVMCCLASVITYIYTAILHTYADNLAVGKFAIRYLSRYLTKRVLILHRVEQQFCHFEEHTTRRNHRLSHRPSHRRHFKKMPCRNEGNRLRRMHVRLALRKMGRSVFGATEG